MTIICDLDDTLVRNGIYPIQRVIDKVNAMGQPVVIITGRPESERAKTVATLRQIGINYKQLLMNPYQPNKQGQLQSKRENAGKVNAVLAIENDPIASKLYKTMGLKTMSPSDL